MKKHITVGRVLIASVVIFLICVLMPNQSAGKPHALVAILGVFSCLTIPICTVLLVVKKIRAKNTLLVQVTSQPTEQQSESEEKEVKQKKLSFFRKIIQEAEERKRLKALEEEERIRIKAENEYKKRNYSSMRYKMIDGVATIWEGETNPASFRIYDNKKRLEGIITKITLNEDGRFYITLTDPDKGTSLVADERELETMILIGSTRYEFTDLCRKVLKIDLSEMFGFANFVRDELYKPRLMLKIDPQQTVIFSHRISGETIRDSFTVLEYYKSNSNVEYLKVSENSNNREVMIPVSKITSMIQLEDSKKIKIDEWLQNICKERDSNQN